MADTEYTAVDEYIARFPDAVQVKLKDIRSRIKTAVPDAVEGIAYKMPAYKLDGKPLVYFAGFKNHIGFYGTPETHDAFGSDLAEYKQGKGSVQFPLDKPIPLDLIARMAEYKAHSLRRG